MSARHSHAGDVPDPGATLSAARAALEKFTLRGCAGVARQVPDPNDPQQVATLKMLEKLRAPEGSRPPSLGAWLRKAIDRGAGTCSPLPGAACGLHVLVLDAQAVAELQQQLASHDRHRAESARMRQILRGAA